MEVKFFEYDQANYPLATLILIADSRPTPYRQKILALARKVARERGISL